MTVPSPSDPALAIHRQDALAARVCSRIGAEYAGGIARGADWAANMRSYELIGDRRRAQRGHLDYLYVRRTGNFGNNVIQLINAAILAERFGIKHVIHRTSWIDDYHAPGGPALLNRPTALAGSYAGLSGTYFVASAISALSDLPPERRLRVFDASIKPGITLTPERATGICLNLRGGYDVFENPDPNRHYGQPPIAYYQTALTRLLQRHGPQEIEIVHQDHRNPVLQPLLHWLEQQDLGHRVTSSGPEGDAMAMLSARHLVIGWTSFSAALALFSPHIESLTAFRGTHLQEVLRRALPRLYLAEDQGRAYFPEGRWRGSARQREMMLSYPAEALSFNDIAVQPDRADEARHGRRIQRAARLRSALSTLGLPRF